MDSLWADTKTFFPLFLQMLRREPAIRSVVVVGAADGKFVMPLVDCGYEVVAIDVNRSALYGGTAPAGSTKEAYPADGSLAHLLEQRGAKGQVELLNLDVRSIEMFPRDALWTSCSWHYSMNHDQPFDTLMRALTSCVRDGGLLGAEYFMPCSASQVASDFFPDVGEVWSWLRGFSKEWEAYTPPFVEAPHLGQPEPHVHRMGFFVARKNPA
jgi:hypothetical protein